MSRTLLKILGGIAFLFLCFLCTLFHKKQVETYFKHQLEKHLALQGIPAKVGVNAGLDFEVALPANAKNQQNKAEHLIQEKLPWIYKAKIQVNAPHMLSEKEAATPSPQKTNPLNTTSKDLQKTLDQATTSPILFEPESADIASSSTNQLNKIAHALNQNPNLKIIVEGHTNHVGLAKDNQILSQKRADAVKDYLIKQDLKNPTRIIAIGYGENKPICKEPSETCKSINRRVVFTVLNP